MKKEHNEISPEEYLRQAEAQKIREQLNALEGRVRRGIEASIHIPIGKATKFARLETPATLDQRKSIEENLERLTTAIKNSGKESKIKEHGDVVFIVNNADIEASFIEPDPEYHEPADDYSNKIYFRINTNGQSIIVDYASRNKGEINLGIIFSKQEEEEISNIAVFSTGKVPFLRGIRKDEAEIISYFTTEAISMIEPPDRK